MFGGQIASYASPKQHESHPLTTACVVCASIFFYKYLFYS